MCLPGNQWPFLYYRDALPVWTSFGPHILQIVWLSVSNIKTGTRRVPRLDELLFETRLERRISKSSSSRRVTRLVPVFILEKDKRTNYKMYAEARPDG